METAAWQRDADAVQLGVDAARRGASVAHQARAVTLYEETGRSTEALAEYGGPALMWEDADFP